jgi:membrane-bound lytic murein transglycosylase B
VTPLSSSRMPRRIPPLLVAGALAVLAMGCADDDTAADAPSTTTTTAAPPTTTTTAPSTTTTEARPAVPVAASTPEGVAEQIVTAERAVRDPSTPRDDLAWFGHLQQVAYRALARQPAWDATAMALVPEDLKPVAMANVTASRELMQLVRTPRETLPAWRIIEATAAEELQAHYREAEGEFGVPWQYLAAVHLVESRMGRLRGTSTAGAQGPMQFIPGTWAAYGEGDINDNRDAIRAAARYLKANGAPERMDNALYRYNPTDHYVRAVTLYAEEMRRDTRAYLGYYHWQVYYFTVKGDVLLPVGYASDTEQPLD